jgi:hypothetical protein
MRTGWLRSDAASERRVCGLKGIAVASYHYRTTRNDEPLRAQLPSIGGNREPSPRFA